MSVSLSQFEYDNIVARRRVKDRNQLVPDATPNNDPESKLHDQIMAHCDAQWPKWQYFHGSMAHKTKRTSGEPDFIIQANRGRTFYVEAKADKGKLKQDQMIVKMKAEMLGHTIHTCHSFEEFLKVIE